MIELGAASSSEDTTLVALERALVGFNGNGHRADGHSGLELRL
jgi:hypothetical protein